MTGPGWWLDVVRRLADHQREHPRTLPGAVVAAETTASGPLVAAVGDGWAADTICNIGSMTKTFTATAVLLALEEAGALDVDAPVHRFPGMDAYAGDEVKRRITVRHLLQHTTGMPVVLAYKEAPVMPCVGPGDPPDLAGADVVGPTVPWIGSPGYTNEPVAVNGSCVPARLAGLGQVAAHVMANYPLLSEPGTEYSYSSANYIVAGWLVECLTSRSPNVYLRERLFGPAGMPDSFFVPQPTGDPELDARIAEDVTDAQRARVADVALITRDGGWPVEVAPGPDGGWDRLRRGWRFVYPDGGMYTTAADLLAFLRLVRDSGRSVLSPAVVELLVTDHGMGHTMGFGYRRSATPYGQGPGTLEHLGNIMTYFWLDPRGGDPLLGVFLSQRLANAIVDNNMVDGLRAIFRGYVPLVSEAAR